MNTAQSEGAANRPGQKRPAPARRRRQSRQISRALWVITALGLAVMLTGGVWLAKALAGYRQADAVYTAWARDAVEMATPGQEGTQQMRVDWDTLLRTNPDVRMWLHGEDGISYPVVQGNNNSYYLRHLLDGTYNIAGSIFLDYRCAGDLSDRHTVIYGHNMKDGTMLSPMAQYADQAYYNAYPTVSLATPDGQYTVELFAAYEQYVGGGYDMALDFSGDEAFLQYVEQAKAQSDFSSGVPVHADDHIVTFVLCTDEGLETTRYFVVGKLTQ